MKFKRKLIGGLVLLAAILIPCFMLVSLNQMIEPQISSIAKIEANNASSKVVQRAIEALNLDTSNLVSLIQGQENEIVGLSYNTEKLNQILNLGLAAATESLMAASKGKEDPNTHMLYYDKGIIYSIPMGYFTGIALFSELGPKIEVRLKVMHASTGEIQVTTIPYGINNTLLRIELVIITEMVVVTPLLMETMPMECRIPLVIQMIQGEVPEMMLEKIAG